FAPHSGWYDPLLQNKAYVDFATDAPGYGPLQSPAVLEKLHESYFEPGGCKDQEEACESAGTSDASNAVCIAADDFCVENVFIPAVGDRDSDDLRQNSSALFPPEFYVSFLGQASIRAAIGAEVTYQECSGAVSRLFGRTGD
ncbi:hypothetical protein C0993_010547, partial [Termitomyces sp. T159_Od127]